METVIQKLRPEAGDSNIFYMKREDLLPFSMGGNKVRIAEAFYADMKAKGGDFMILYGSRHSNLCRVLSALCRSRGTECAVICSHEGEEDSAMTCNTHLIDWTGTRMYHCRKDNIADTVDAAVRDARACGKTPYYIYGDRYGRGNESTAAAAYAQAYEEITDYERRQGFSFDYLFCPCGTGATLSGLICGHLLAGDATEIVGVLISSRETGRALQVLEDGICGYFQKNGLVLPEGYRGEIRLLDQYRKGGYGCYDREIEDCIRAEYLRDGIPLDPVYTAKAFLGMKTWLRERGVSGKRILFLHTGGTPLFYDYLMKTTPR